MTTLVDRHAKWAPAYVQHEPCWHLNKKGSMSTGDDLSICCHCGQTQRWYVSRTHGQWKP